MDVYIFLRCNSLYRVTVQQLQAACCFHRLRGQTQPFPAKAGCVHMFCFFDETASCCAQSMFKLCGPLLTFHQLIASQIVTFGNMDLYGPVLAAQQAAGRLHAELPTVCSMAPCNTYNLHTPNLYFLWLQIVTFGNMDTYGPVLAAQQAASGNAFKNGTLLCDGSIEAEGYRIVASPWTPAFEVSFLIFSNEHKQQQCEKGLL